MEHVWIAFGLTLVAGLSTGIGSALAFFVPKLNTKFLSFALGFSAGVMIYISLAEILGKSNLVLEKSLGSLLGNWITLVSFFSGVALIAIIDLLIPNIDNPHEFEHDKSQLDKLKGDRGNSAKLLRMGFFMAIALAIHNFPEGLATFIAALQQPSIAIPIVFAIAIHNIPEGIAVSVPIYYATGSRKKAFWYSFASGLSEPLGAIVGYLLLKPILTDSVFGIVFAGVAGIMVYISFDELLPASRAYGEHHTSIIGLFSGMAVMAISLLLFV